MVILLTISIALSFAGNALNPSGIPLFGQWDPERGSVHAGGPCTPSTDQVRDIDVLDLYLSSGALFVDARSREDFAEAHIPRSVNLPVNEVQDDIHEFMDRVSRETKLIVYCSGVECTDSHEVAEALREYGYTDVHVYAQGMHKWQSEGRPLESVPSLEEQ